MPVQVNRTKNISNFSASKQNDQLILLNKIKGLSAVANPKLETKQETVQIAVRSPQQRQFSSNSVKKSYAQRQKDNTNEGLLYGAGAYAGLFGACAIASGVFVSAPIAVPAVLLGVSLVSSANVLRKAYDISQEK